MSEDPADTVRDTTIPGLEKCHASGALEFDVHG